MRRIIPHAFVFCALLHFSSNSVSAKETQHSLEGKVLWPGMPIEIFRVRSGSFIFYHSFHELPVCRR